MTKYLICFCLTVITFDLAAQPTTINKLNQVGVIIDSFRFEKIREIREDSAREQYFSRRAYDRFFDKYFTQIKYERESFTEGNSAALKVADNKTSLNLTLSHKSQNSIFSAGTSLNITDNSGVIFSGDKPTAGTEIFGSFSFLFPSLRKLWFDGKDMANNYRKRFNLVDSLWRVNSKRNPAYAQLLLAKLHTYDSLFHRYDDSTSHPSPSTNIQLYNDSLVSIIDKQVKARQELESFDNGRTSAAGIAESVIKYAEDASVAKELATDGVTSFYMGWLTTGLSYRRDDYATYDSLLLFSKRIADQNFDKWSINTAFNFFWQRTDSWIAFRKSRFVNSFYANINYSLVRTNTFQDLDELSLSAIRTRTQNDTSYQFANTKKVRDISGNTFSQGWLNKIGFAATAMMGKKQFFGLNISGSTDIRRNHFPVLNSHVGALFRFKDSEDEKSIVNFELFFAFNDMTDTKQKGKSVWQQKQIGISATVPFKKVFFR